MKVVGFTSICRSLNFFFRFKKTSSLAQGMV
jgi:hypothetical protein